MRQRWIDRIIMMLLYALVQLGSIRSGVLRVSARELWEEMRTARKEMKKHYQK